MRLVLFWPYVLVHSTGALCVHIWALWCVCVMAIQSPTDTHTRGGSDKVDSERSGAFFFIDGYPVTDGMF